MNTNYVWLLLVKTSTKLTLKGVYSHENEAENAMIHMEFSEDSEGESHVIHRVGLIDYAARDVAEDEILWEKS